MPNVIVELTREMRRVQELLPRMNAHDGERAQRTIYFANLGMTANSLEAMKESIEDLKLIVVPKK